MPELDQIDTAAEREMWKWKQRQTIAKLAFVFLILLIFGPIVTGMFIPDAVIAMTGLIQYSQAILAAVVGGYMGLDVFEKFTANRAGSN